MIEQQVSFYSFGERVSGLLRLPDSDGPFPGIVQGPGWLGLKDAALYSPYHEALTDAGFAVLIFDYRGFGDSDGNRNTLSPRTQLEDLVNAVTYLETRSEIDPNRIGAFGSGGTGGGNAVLLAASDQRVNCVVAQVPVSDGEDWLRRMRADGSEWEAFLHRLAADRRNRVLTGQSEMVHPREEIMIPSAERRATTVKSDVDGRIPTSVALWAADEILAYRPIDAVSSVQRLCVIAVDGDVVTPTDHATALYDAAPEPKKLIIQHDTTHYAAYRQHGPVVIPQIVDWFVRHIDGANAAGADQVEVHS